MLQDNTEMQIVHFVKGRPNSYLPFWWQLFIFLHFIIIKWLPYLLHKVLEWNQTGGSVFMHILWWTALSPPITAQTLIKASFQRERRLSTLTYGLISHFNRLHDSLWKLQETFIPSGKFTQTYTSKHRKKTVEVELADANICTLPNFFKGFCLVKTM